jgi:hypothetical protein
MLARKSRILFVPVCDATARCSGGVVVKKGCAYRSGSGLARRRRLLVFFAMIGSPYGLGRMRKMSL